MDNITLYIEILHKLERAEAKNEVTQLQKQLGQLMQEMKNELHDRNMVKFYEEESERLQKGILKARIHA